MEVVRKSISVLGFIFAYLMPKYGADFIARWLPKLLLGTQWGDHEHVFDGLASSEEAILVVQKGLNKAKVVIHVADE